MFKRVKDKLLDILGDIKVFKHPMFIVYDPDTYKVGAKTRRYASKLVRPGDILMRTFSGYLDRYFIPGQYSHSGIYIGNSTVIHAVSPVIEEIDILDFLECDGFVVLRPIASTSGIDAAIATALNHIGICYDFDFDSDDERLYCHELSATCYPQLGLEQQPVSMLGIPTGKRVYTADSFLKCDKFKVVYEFSVKDAVDMKREEARQKKAKKRHKYQKVKANEKQA